jgi:DNA-binding response OmpR family regulator
MSIENSRATVVVCSASEQELATICDHLIAQGLRSLPAVTGPDASRLCRYGRADVLIVDLGLPEDAAVDLLRERTGREDFPEIAVIALMGSDQDPAMLTGAGGLGVEGCLRRPFNLDDLDRSLETLLLRRHNRDDQVTRVGSLVIDPPRRKVTVGDREVRLARKEFLLLRVLATDPTRVFSKDELMSAVWGTHRPAGTTRTLDSHASRLRSRLDPECKRFVVNCWGIGYRLLDSLEAAGRATTECVG